MIREVDKIAAGKYPEADDLWPCVASDAYVFGILFGHPPEFYRYAYSEIGPQWGDYTGPMTFNEYRATLQKQRTRAALIAYAGRTGDWDTVRRILK